MHDLSWVYKPFIYGSCFFWLGEPTQLQWIRRPKRLLHLLCDVAEALAFMHGQWFAHLDVKPHNILVLEGEANPLHQCSRSVSNDQSFNKQNKNEKTTWITWEAPTGNLTFCMFFTMFFQTVSFRGGLMWHDQSGGSPRQAVRFRHGHPHRSLGLPLRPHGDSRLPGVLASNSHPLGPLGHWPGKVKLYWTCGKMWPLHISNAVWSCPILHSQTSRSTCIPLLPCKFHACHVDSTCIPLVI